MARAETAAQTLLTLTIDDTPALIDRADQPGPAEMIVFAFALCAALRPWLGDTDILLRSPLCYRWPAVWGATSRPSPCSPPPRPMVGSSTAGSRLPRSRRFSATAGSAEETYDVSETALAREVIAAERARLEVTEPV